MALLDPSASQGNPHEGSTSTICVDFSQNNSTTDLITSSVHAGSYINTNSLPFNSASGAKAHPLSAASDGAGGPLSHVLSGFQQAGELSSVLQQQPELVQDLSAIASGDVSTDPESLRFQYRVEETTSKPVSSKKTPTVYREQDRFLPIANVARTMRNAIPKNGKVSKDAKECMQECVSEFVSFITSEACDKCMQEKRKTITGDDILFAMATLGFDNYIEPLRLYLQKYREYTRSEKVVPGSVSRNGSGGAEAMTGLEQTGTAFGGGTVSSTQMSDFSSF